MGSGAVIRLPSSRFASNTVATLRAGGDLVPGGAPFLAPSKRSPADDADFLGQIDFFVCHRVRHDAAVDQPRYARAWMTFRKVSASGGLK